MLRSRESIRLSLLKRGKDGNVRTIRFFDEQMQMEREKQNYDFENVQSQLDKALGQSTRMQKERETIQLEVDRLQDKYEKAQVSALSVTQRSIPLHRRRYICSFFFTPTDDNATAAEGERRVPRGNGQTAREDRVPAESNSEDATGQGERIVGARIGEGEMGEGSQLPSKVNRKSADKGSAYERNVILGGLVSRSSSGTTLSPRSRS